MSGTGMAAGDGSGSDDSSVDPYERDHGPAGYDTHSGMMGYGSDGGAFGCSDGDDWDY